MQGSTARDRFNMLLLTIFGVMALILAAVGIFGLMAYSVAQRRQEIGIRMALGADRSGVRRLIVWSGMRLALFGVALGLGAGVSSHPFDSELLFGVRPWDPLAFVVAPMILFLVALIAVWLPGARASRIDPIEVLRME